MLFAHRYKDIRSGRLPTNNRSHVELRFWKRVNKDGPIHPVYGQCWQWEGVKDRCGYGVMMIKRKPNKAHRYAYSLLVTTFSLEKEILHHCDNPSCVNPDHLFLGDKLINIKDKVGKGRQARGETQWYSKFTDEQVKEIRGRHVPRCRKNGLSAIAREKGVTVGTIWHIVHRRNWKHV